MRGKFRFLRYGVLSVSLLLAGAALAAEPMRLVLALSFDDRNLSEAARSGVVVHGLR